MNFAHEFYRFMVWPKIETTPTLLSVIVGRHPSWESESINFNNMVCHVTTAWGRVFGLGAPDCFFFSHLYNELGDEISVYRS